MAVKPDAALIGGHARSRLLTETLHYEIASFYPPFAPPKEGNVLGERRVFSVLLNPMVRPLIYQHLVGSYILNACLTVLSNHSFLKATVRHFSSSRNLIGGSPCAE